MAGLCRFNTWRGHDPDQRFHSHSVTKGTTLAKHLQSMAHRCFQNFINALEQAGGLKRRIFGIAVAALFLVSCGTPATRISQNPGIYQGLSPRDQALVSQGQIRLGMSMDAVWLAWGTPEQKIPGYGRGRPTETWVYLRYDTPPSYGGPYYYGPFDWSYIPPKFPYPSKGVTFADGRVVFFRHLPAPPPLGW
jgi:hypothetical protein